MVKTSLETPRVLIGAPGGRSGKTTISLGICAALAGRGMRVQPFKKGPDYIDPSWLSAAAGRACKTLDPYFLAPPGSNLSRVLPSLMNQRLEGADFALVEANHGLYDSAVSEDGWGSAAMLARLTGTPVVLVVSAVRASRSLAALVSGFQAFEADTPIRAVVLNQVAGSAPGGRHEQRARRAIEHYCGLPVVGALPRDDQVVIPDRHLGLVPVGERDELPAAIQACKQAVESSLDLERILEIGASAPAVACDPPVPEGEPAASPGSVPLGVLRDRAFSFYYPENLAALERQGARLVFIDALQDTELPPLGGLYIGGGFPEVFAGELQANRALRLSVRQAIEDGLPVYAECGGLMYLCRSLSWRGETYEMVAALPYDVEMTERPQGHGYVTALVDVENPYFPLGKRLRGHEFHNSRLLNLAGDMHCALTLQRGRGLGQGQDGLLYRNVFAAYTHLHADGAPGWAYGLVSQARRYAAGELGAG